MTKEPINPYQTEHFEEADSFTSALGITDERADELQSSSWEFIKESMKNDTGNSVEVLRKSTKSCRNVNESVYITYLFASFLTKIQHISKEDLI